MNNITYSFLGHFKEFRRITAMYMNPYSGFVKKCLNAISTALHRQHVIVPFKKAYLFMFDVNYAYYTTII